MGLLLRAARKTDQTNRGSVSTSRGICLLKEGDLTKGIAEGLFLLVKGDSVDGGRAGVKSNRGGKI